MNNQEAIRIDSLGEWKRTHDCGSLRKENVGQEVTLMGWVNGRRDLGNLIFIDLRDRGGLTQIVFDPQADEKAIRNTAQTIGRKIRDEDGVEQTVKFVEQFVGKW